MPSFSTEVPHTLGKEAAVEKLKDFLVKVKEDFKDQVSEMEGEWNDNVLTFSLTSYGFKIDGTLTAEEDSAKIAGSLPFAAAMFRGKIESSMAKELTKVLN